MPHVSKKLVPKETFLRIKKELIDSLSKLPNLDASIVAHELLTKTEKVMIAKRLAIIYLLYNKASQYFISNFLNVSSSTVERYSYKYDRGQFNGLLNILKRKRKYQAFWKVLERLLKDQTPTKYRKRKTWLSKNF